MKDEPRVASHPSLWEYVNPPVSSASSIFYVMAYTVVSLLVYAYAAHKLTIEERPLRERCFELTETRASLKKATLELSEMVASLSDPAADEYALIMELGRIPRGSYKIMFVKPGKKAS